MQDLNSSISIDSENERIIQFNDEEEKIESPTEKPMNKKSRFAFKAKSIMLEATTSKEDGDEEDGFKKPMPLKRDSN